MRAILWPCRGSGCESGAGIWLLDGSSERDGGMVEVVPDRYGGDAGNRSVLDRAVRRSRTAWHPGGTGERAAHQKCAGVKDRCAGMPVADEVAHLRTDARFVPTTAGHGIPADNLASAGPARQGGRTGGAAHAEGADQNEHSA